jgi:putative NIF3 family GTP cyclohydrolase 1 type 2
MHLGKNLTRRRFLLLTGATLSTARGFQSQLSGPTANQIIERIQKQVGVPWRSRTVDTFKAGNPETRVKGIATSFSATLDVCQRAAASGKNLIIVHEPTFYNHLDETKDLKGEIYQVKRTFIEKNSLVIWRFHDHWHDRRPDGILTGMVAALGWGKQQSEKDPEIFDLPSCSLETLVKNIQRQMKIHSLRVIGNSQMQVRRVALAPGYNDLREIMRWLDNPAIEALVIGETREWEGVEYARDAVTAGRNKALIILGHVPSEERGMQECAQWLKTFIPEVPIEYLPGGEPFWSPKTAS